MCGASPCVDHHNSDARRDRNVRELSPRLSAVLAATVVITEKSADALSTANGPAGMRLSWRIDQLVLKSLVVSFAIVVCDEVGERPPEVAFTWRDHTIQAFLFDRANEPLRMRIAVWCPERCPDHADARCREEALDAKAPLAITITDQHAIRVEAAVGVLRQVAHGRDEEGFIGMRGGLQNLDPTRVEFDHKHGVEG